jgi:hypothetical protein
MPANPKSDRIRLLHPEGKKGVNMVRSKYEQMHAEIVKLLDERAEVGFTEALEIIEKRLEGKFDGKIAWYYVSVKLDMEAKGELVRLPGKGLQMMRKA